MPFCEITLEGSPVMSSPLKMMRPEVGRSTPVRQLKNVLLPAPFGPMMARTSSRSTSKLTCVSAASPPKRTDSSSVLRIGTDAAPRLARRGAYGRSTGCALTYAAGKWQAGGTMVLSFGTVSLRLDRSRRWTSKMNSLQEGLVIFLAQRLVALREVVAGLHLEAFERLDQLHGVVAALELRLLHARSSSRSGLRSSTARICRAAGRTDRSWPAAPWLRRRSLW